MNRVVPSGFLAWRTPLLPFDELLAWSDGLEAPAATDDETALEDAVATDRHRLRERLRAVVARPEVREALFVAAPDLEQFVDAWLAAPDSPRGQRVEVALARYFLRMAGRATPFGLFAGGAVAAIGDDTRLVLDARRTYTRHTRLDMDYLVALTEALGREPSVRDTLLWYPNTSLYRSAGRVRYVESRFEDHTRTFHLVAVNDSKYLRTTLERAADGETSSRLAAALADEGVPRPAAEAYIAQLIENQVLVSDLAPAVTGPEPIHGLADRLRGSAATSAIASRLVEVRAALASIDASALGVEPERYRLLARELATLDVPVAVSRLFQVDLVKSSPDATLGREVVGEILRGATVLHRLFGRSPRAAMDRFREAFVARYEQQEIPLLEALDEEAGIGFFSDRASNDDATPLLRGIALPPARTKTVPWQPADGLVLRTLIKALERQAFEIEIDARELDTSDSDDRQPLPDAFAVMATVGARDASALSRGDFQVHVRSASGPSGACLLGRFCHADDALHRQVERHLRAEESLHPRAVFAEVVHLGEDRIGNVLLRPVLREYEIPYLGRSGASRDRQIPVSDLRVSVRDDRILLRSARLGCEVVPRLTTAHNFSRSTSAVYRFLCSLQAQATASVSGWDWGVAREVAPFTPRVTMGRLVLALAQWRLNEDDIRRLSAGRAAARFRAVQIWRAERRLPRWVALADADNVLPIDLENVLSVEAFLHLIGRREGAVVTELFPPPDLMCARGPEGRFVHELIVPFERQPEAVTSAAAVRPRAAPAEEVARSHRSFPPGSEWLYAKVYTGRVVADQVLRDIVKPLVGRLLESGAAESWFFVRYADPDCHLRLRLRGAPQRLHAEAFPALRDALASSIADGRVRRLQLDTYDREIERYGGPDGIGPSEELFRVDSEAVLAILERLERDDAGLDERWRLTLRGIDALLDDFGFDLRGKQALVEGLRKRYAAEFRVGSSSLRRLNDRLREEKPRLEALLDAAHDAASGLWPGIEILRRRSRLWAPAIARLKDLDEAGRLSASWTDLAASHAHMHANRLLRSAQRPQELAIYHFLARLYDSRLARERSWQAVAKTA